MRLSRHYFRGNISGGHQFSYALAAHAAVTGESLLFIVKPGTTEPLAMVKLVRPSLFVIGKESDLWPGGYHRSYKTWGEISH